MDIIDKEWRELQERYARQLKRYAADGWQIDREALKRTADKLLISPEQMKADLKKARREHNRKEELRHKQRLLQTTRGMRETLQQDLVNMARTEKELVLAIEELQVEVAGA